MHAWRSHRQRGEAIMLTVDESLRFADQQYTKQSFAGVLAAEVRRLQAEIEQERKRLDWALKNEAVYYCWGGVWRLCFNGSVLGSDEDIPTANPRATIDELMEKAT